MKIKDIPWYNRPGAKLKQKGVGSLSDAELLAIVLGRGDKNENAIDLSNRVLGYFNFHKLSDLSLFELEKVVRNNVKAMKIQAIFEITRRTYKLKKKGFKTKIKTAEDVFHYFIDELEIKNKVYFYVLFLDTKNRIIGNELVFEGSLKSSLITPREIFIPAIKACANSIILVNNHFNGDCEPSKDDKEITKIINDVGNLLGIYLIDHVVIGNDNYKSVKE